MLADHRGDRKAWLIDTLGLSVTDDTGRHCWQQVTSDDPDYLSLSEGLARVVAERVRGIHAFDEGRRRA
ncbi:MAG TPA: hypothetical protein VGJ54_13030, partial [Streptosporangiaceae bacterium]